MRNTNCQNVLSSRTTWSFHFAEYRLHPVQEVPLPHVRRSTARPCRVLTSLFLPSPYSAHAAMQGGFGFATAFNDDSRKTSPRHSRV